jgi:8-oxo-dGTP diphosphatase
MAKSSKLVVAKRGRVLLVSRRRDQRLMFPGERRRGRESDIRGRFAHRIQHGRRLRARCFTRHRARRRRTGEKRTLKLSGGTRQRTRQFGLG